jgi:diphosphomevalonate decarboxylase
MPDSETSGLATAVACANIAFVKYWGNVVPVLRLPFNNSLSMNLSAATSTTTVEFDGRLQTDEIALDDLTLHGAARERVVGHLDLVRDLAKRADRAKVTSHNSFPTGTGIASSAAGFAALSVSAAAAAGLDMSERELSALARRGSGSASRSIPSGFVEWQTASEDADSYAWSIAPPEHWDLRDIVAVVSQKHKSIGSGGGHDAATTSPHFPARIRSLPGRLNEVRRAIIDRDLERLGPVVEAEALDLHAMAMTSRPPILYWTAATVNMLQAVWRWRADGLPVYFTLDAGPNVHLLCEGKHAEALEAEVSALDYVESCLHNRAAGPARLLPNADESVTP